MHVRLQQCCLPLITWDLWRFRDPVLLYTEPWSSSGAPVHTCEATAQWCVQDVGQQIGRAAVSALSPAVCAPAVEGAEGTVLYCPSGLEGFTRLFLARLCNCTVQDMSLDQNHTQVCQHP